MSTIQCLKRIALCAVLSASVALIVGCQASASVTPQSTASAPLAKAVLITTGNGVSYVLYPTADNNGVQMLSTNGSADTCAQCQADAIKAFHGESIAEVCPKCGAKRTVLSAVPPAVPGH